MLVLTTTFTSDSKNHSQTYNLIIKLNSKEGHSLEEANYNENDDPKCSLHEFKQRQ
jgi:hypothetical protein